MNNSTQAQKGFKTFLLTLSVSLIIFSAIYYVITNTSSQTDTLAPDIGTTQEEKGDEVSQKTPATAFSQLAAQKLDIQGRAVLAGATTNPGESTQSTTTVPVTGVVGITVGLFAAAFMFVAGMFVIAKDPRKLAISSFEKNTVKKL